MLRIVLIVDGCLHSIRIADLKSSVISRKLTHLLFASMVSLRLWSLNVLQMFFLIFSIPLGVLLNAARPSSLNKVSSLLKKK